MAKKGKSGSNRGGDKGNLISLVITVIIIILILYLLENLKHRVPDEPAVENAPPAVTALPPVDRDPQHIAPSDENDTKILPLPPPVVSTKEPTKDLSPAQKPISSSASVHARPKVRKKHGGRVAIIVDDMGGHLREAETLLAIGIPITFAIIPSLPHAGDVARHAHGKGYEVMLHIPMEPKDYPNRRLEKDGLLLSLADDEIERRVSHYISTVPYADGANNHMGSRFTEDKAKMRVVLKALGRRGLFFIDSKTSPVSVGERLAAEMGVRKGGRDVFLDNVQDPSAIKKQLEELVTRARRYGGAVGICHPHPATIKSLQAFLPVLQAEGVMFVRASEMVN